jgi:hypothetical protein
LKRHVTACVVAVGLVAACAAPPTPAPPSTSAPSSSPRSLTASPASSPAIVCGRIEVSNCRRSIELVRRHTGDLSRVNQIAVDDACPPGTVCDRLWDFEAFVVLSTLDQQSSDAGTVATLAYLVTGNAGPQDATPFRGELPTHIKALLSRT